MVRCVVVRILIVFAVHGVAGSLGRPEALPSCAGPLGRPEAVQRPAGATSPNARRQHLGHDGVDAVQRPAGATCIIW